MRIKKKPPERGDFPKNPRNIKRKGESPPNKWRNRK
jgi:hypothetical protein